MQKKDYPISVLKKIKLLQQEFRKLIFQNSNLIDRIDDPLVISLEYKKKRQVFL
jgi:hypothetical protein